MNESKSIVLLMIVIATGLSLVTTNSFAAPVMASAKGGGSVVQEQVKTGNSNLDKEINKFYNCISKTHQDPPSIEKVDNCYYQALDASAYSSGSISGSVSNQPQPKTLS